MTKKEKLEAKLKLWDNPVFLEFIRDIQALPDNPIDIEVVVRMMKLTYKVDLKEIEQKESKYKQGKLGL